MLLEDKTTRCPKCDGPLTWRGRVRRWAEDREVEEFVFACEPCGKQLVFRDGRLFERRPVRDTAAETTEIRRLEHSAAEGRRCDRCGGPIFPDARGYWCGWCHQTYELRDGVFTPAVFLEPRKRPRMADFYGE
jgi:uncharacterized protein with PIN domain